MGFMATRRNIPSVSSWAVAWLLGEFPAHTPGITHPARVLSGAGKGNRLTKDEPRCFARCPASEFTRRPSQGRPAKTRSGPGEAGDTSEASRPPRGSSGTLSFAGPGHLGPGPSIASIRRSIEAAS